MRTQSDIRELLGRYIARCEEEKSAYPPAAPVIVIPAALYNIYQLEVDEIARHYDALVVVREDVRHQPQVNLPAIVERLKQRKFYG